MIEVLISSLWRMQIQKMHQFLSKTTVKKVICSFFSCGCATKCLKIPMWDMKYKKIKLLFSHSLTIFSKNNLTCDDNFILFKKLSLILEQLYLNKYIA